MHRSRTLSGASHALSHLLPKPYSLGSLSDSALRQLTELLAMDPHAGLEGPSDAWLLSQHHRISLLGRELLRPKGMLNHIVLSAGEHSMPSFAPCAVLCPSHTGLDPRIIRELLHRVGQECTVRVDRYRRYKGPLELDPALVAWMDRMDATTALWLGKHTFESIFGYTVAMPSKRITCEACILATIGGKPQIISDLRVSLVARQIAKSTHDRPRDPRLLRVVEKWAAALGVSVWVKIQNAEETMVPLILNAREIVLRERDNEDMRRRMMGKRPLVRTHREILTHQGLPMPRMRRARKLPRRGEKDSDSSKALDGLVTMSGALPAVNEDDVFGDGYAMDDAHGVEEEDVVDDGNSVEEDDVFDDENATDYEDVDIDREAQEEEEEIVSNWIRREQDQQNHGNAHPEPDNTLGIQHNNATFESFGASSAVPPPLNINPGHIARREAATLLRSTLPPRPVTRASVRTHTSARAPSRASRASRSTDRYSRYSWTDVSVYSLDSGDDSDAAPTIPKRSSRRLEPKRKSIADCTYTEFPPPKRRTRAVAIASGGTDRPSSITQPSPYTQPFPPASSVYSQTGGPPASPSVATEQLPFASRGRMLQRRAPSGTQRRRDESKGSPKQGRGAQRKKMPPVAKESLERLEKQALTSESLLGLGTRR